MLSCDLFKKNISDLIKAAGAARQGYTVEEDTVSGLMFADDFVVVSDTPGEVAETNREESRIP